VNEEQAMTYVIVARWRAKEGKAEEIEGILRELVPATRAEPGTLMFIGHRSHDNPDEFLIYEQYVDEAAFVAHQQMPHFKTLVLERALPLLAERERLAFGVLATR